MFILSAGKGGAGKTSVVAQLLSFHVARGGRAVGMDCDTNQALHTQFVGAAEPPALMDAIGGLLPTLYGNNAHAQDPAQAPKSIPPSAGSPLYYGISAETNPLVAAAHAIQPHSRLLSDEIIALLLMSLSVMTERAASIDAWVAFAAQAFSMSRSRWTALAMLRGPRRLFRSHCRRCNADRDECANRRQRTRLHLLDLLDLEPRLAIRRYRRLERVLVLEARALLGLLDADLGNEAKPVEIAP